MNLLAVETSADFCSVAACRGEAIFARHEPAGQRQAELILDMVDAVLVEAGLTAAALGGIAYGAGPGSFTGLRIACGVTQGIALARSIPVIGVGTLLALVEEAVEEAVEETAQQAVGQALQKALGEAAYDRVIACLDARMGEVYHAAYRRRAGGVWEEILAPGLYFPDAVPLPCGEGWIGCGSGFAAHAARLAARHGERIAAVRPEVAPSARAVLRLALPRFLAGEARDAASAIPVYLRDKVALKTSER